MLLVSILFYAGEVREVNITKLHFTEKRRGGGERYLKFLAKRNIYIICIEVHLTCRLMVSK